MTTLHNIKAIAANAARAMTTAREEPDAGKATEHARAAVNLRAHACDLLADNPLRVEHPIFGVGLLQAVTEGGLASVLFDDGDTAETVQLDLLEVAV